MKDIHIFPWRLILLVVLTSLATGCRAVESVSPPENTPTEKQYTPLVPTQTPDTTKGDREQMVLRQIEARGIEDPEVLSAMISVPRHQFVPENYLSQAYADHPLPIGYGQTISQPYIVALMTESLRLEKGDRVLEIGTGSGYQAAVLAELDTQVYTVEIIPELASAAEERLIALGYTNIEVLNADGYFGWEEKAPFDAVIVTAAPDHLPQPLIEQMAVGARLVIPIGPVGAVQTLWLFEKSDDDVLALNLGPVKFVPLTGEH
jgi:protein-L-isoaspartate(D-aspartate) O-methyltransferase